MRAQVIEDQAASAGTEPWTLPAWPASGPAHCPTPARLVPTASVTAASNLPTMTPPFTPTQDITDTPLQFSVFMKSTSDVRPERSTN